MTLILCLVLDTELADSRLTLGPCDMHVDCWLKVGTKAVTTPSHATRAHPCVNMCSQFPSSQTSISSRVIYSSSSWLMESPTSPSPSSPTSSTQLSHKGVCERACALVGRSVKLDQSLYYVVCFITVIGTCKLQQSNEFELLNHLNLD